MRAKPLAHWTDDELIRGYAVILKTPFGSPSPISLFNQTAICLEIDRRNLLIHA